MQTKTTRSMRIVSAPNAECADKECTWGYTDRNRTHLNAVARRHVEKTGHDVVIEVLDRELIQRKS